MSTLLRLLIFVSLLWASVVHAQCSIGNKFVDDAIVFLKTIKAVNSFKFHSGFKGGRSSEGTVVSFHMTSKFTAIRLEPTIGGHSSFIFGIDLLTKKFYAYYTDGISKPFPNLIEGVVNPEMCSIQFKANESELLEIELLAGNNMNLYSKKKEGPNQRYTVIHRFDFKSSAPAN